MNSKMKRTNPSIKCICRALLSGIGVVIALLLWLAQIGTARANGAPVDVYLGYLPEVSNWGPQNAKGHAVVAVGEGEVSLEVWGLPRLKEEHYEVWLESRNERKLYSVGKFNVGADGVGRLHVLLDTLPYQEYRMLLITVEPEPDPSPEPSNRRSLAGLFPNTAIIQTTTEITDTQSVQAQTPPYLPVTGHRHGLWLALIVPWGVALSACAAWALRFARRRFSP